MYIEPVNLRNQFSTKGGNPKTALHQVEWQVVAVFFQGFLLVLVNL